MKLGKLFKTFLALVAFTAGSLVASSAAMFDVLAAQNSSSGGTPLSTIYLTAGQTFTVSVSPTDLWNAGPLPRWSNANGLVGNLYATGSDESGLPYNTLIGQNYGTWTQYGLTAPYGMLVGRIGTTYIPIGVSYSGVAPVTGYLDLMYWDSNNGDNTEKIAISADVAILPVPEPSTVIAGALLLLPFGASALRKLRKNR